jgi:hypothetical protein
LSDPLTATLAPDDTPLYRTQWFDLAPRFGAAFQASDRLVVRGGVGLFHDVGYSYVGNMLGYSLLPYGGFAGAGGVSLSDPVVGTLPERDELGAYGGVAVFDPNYETPNSLQYNVALERQLDAATTVSAAYVGAHGRDLERLERWEVPGGVAGLPTSRLDIIRNNGWMDYQSLQLQYRRRLSGGFQALASYALSRSIGGSAWRNSICPHGVPSGCPGPPASPLRSTHSTCSTIRTSPTRVRACTTAAWQTSACPTSASPRGCWAGDSPPPAAGSVRSIRSEDLGRCS